MIKEPSKIPDELKRGLICLVAFLKIKKECQQRIIKTKQLGLLAHPPLLKKPRVFGIGYIILIYIILGVVNP